MAHNDKRGITRREFARFAALAGWIPWALHADVAWAQAPSIGPAPASSDEAYWLKVREQVLMPRDLGVMNAANLCPSSAPVLQALYEITKDMEANPSGQNRRKLAAANAATRKALAEVPSGGRSTRSRRTWTRTRLGRIVASSPPERKPPGRRSPNSCASRPKRS